MSDNDTIPCNRLKYECNYMQQSVKNPSAPNGFQALPIEEQELIKAAFRALSSKSLAGEQGVFAVVKRQAKRDEKLEMSFAEALDPFLSSREFLDDCASAEQDWRDYFKTYQSRDFCNSARFFAEHGRLDPDDIDLFKFMVETHMTLVPTISVDKGVPKVQFAARPKNKELGFATLDGVLAYAFLKCAEVGAAPVVCRKCDKVFFPARELQPTGRFRSGPEQSQFCSFEHRNQFNRMSTYYRQKKEKTKLKPKGNRKVRRKK